MEKPVSKRAAGFVKPDYWTNEPIPAPVEPKIDEQLSPTRYGDWVRDGIAVDF